MAFRKTSIGVTPPTPVVLVAPQVGDEKDGMVWDGEKWVAPEGEFSLFEDIKTSLEAAIADSEEPKGSQLPSEPQ